MVRRLKIRERTLGIFIVWLGGSTLFTGCCISGAWHDILSGNLLAIGVIGLIIFLIFIPVLIASATYLYEDLSKKVYIDKENETLTIHKRGKEILIEKADIAESYHVKTPPYANRRLHRLYGYEYLLLVLKERRKVYITNLLSEPQEIINFFTLQCKTIETSFPLLYAGYGSGVLTAREFEQKVNEFQQHFQDYSAEKLRSVVHNRREYADYAIEAAKRILEERKSLPHTIAP